MGNGKRYLVAADLEGIHGVVGVPYETLNGAPDFEIAKVNAAKEINAVVRALYDSGASRVDVWANHGGADNLDYPSVDPRATIVPRNTERLYRRFYFIPEGERYDGMILLGYHSREGTVGGVLAHTYNSKGIQYYKLNGRAIGEIEFDSYVAGYLGFSTILVASDDICVNQAKETLPKIETVITKYGKGRNAADFRESEVVLADLYAATLRAIERVPAPLSLDFPCSFEIRTTRIEDAAIKYERYKERGIEATYGEDGHVLCLTLRNMDEMQSLLFL